MARVEPGGVSVATPVRSIVALSVGACGSAAALRVCDPLLPRLSAEYGVGLGVAAQAVTAFAAAYGVLQLVYGPVGDRYGKYRVITIATLASALTSLACALAPGFTAFVIARMLAGATAGALIPLSMAWIGDVVPYESRQPVLARFIVGQMFGVAVGQLLGGMGADYLGVRPVFLALAALFAATSWLMWRFAPARAIAPPPVTDGGILGRFVAVLEVRWARFVLATVFVEGVLLVGALAFIPTHLHRVYALPLTLAGSAVMLFAAGGLVFAALSRTLVRRLGEVGLAAIGGILLMLSFAAIALASAVLVAVAGCLVAGLGFYMLHNTLQVNATQMMPAQRGSSLALFAAILFIGHATGVTLAGYAAERLGTAPVILAAGVLLLVLGLVFGAARRRRSASATETTMVESG